MPTDDDLTKLVNASGFALQLGLQHAIINSQAARRWRFVSREHPWVRSDSQGFIDIVLQAGVATAVIESKRPRDGTWVFLVPNGEHHKDTATRVLWIAGDEHGRALSGWDSIAMPPETYVSAFCTVRGTGEADRPMLERICATLLASTEALADSEVAILQRQQMGWKGFFLPIIVTTAELYVCRLAPDRVDLTTGMLDSAQFEPVPYLRFHKTFPVADVEGKGPNSLKEAATQHERTVIVVRAEALTLI